MDAHAICLSDERDIVTSLNDLLGFAGEFALFSLADFPFMFRP